MHPTWIPGGVPVTIFYQYKFQEYFEKNTEIEK